MKTRIARGEACALCRGASNDGLSFLLLYVDTPFDVFVSDGVPTLREALRGRFDE